MYSGPQDTRVLSGVMDQDSAAWAVAPENYRYALNLVNAYNTQAGSHTNMRGTVEVINAQLKNGTNKCVGYFEDVKGQSVIFLVYNSIGYHAVFRWYQSDDSIHTCYQVQQPGLYSKYAPNPLEFDPDYLVTGINLVDDLLYWVGYNSSPKMLNVARADETGKRRQFKLYFNPQCFGAFTNNLVHTLTLYLQGQATPVATLTWNMVPTTLTRADAITELMSAYAGSTFSNYVRLEDKGNYVEAQVGSPGIYVLEWTNNAFAPYYSGVIIPDNFYPDQSATPYTYDPTSHQLLERVKYPPKCPPTAGFITDGEGRFNFTFDQLIAQNEPSTPNGFTPISYYTWYYYSGVSNVLADTLGLVTTGTANVIGPSTPTPYGVFNGFIENTTSGPLSVNISGVITITLSGWASIPYYGGTLGSLAGNNQPANQAMNMFLGVNTNTSTPPAPLFNLWSWNAASYVGGGELDPTTTYTIPYNVSVILQPGQQLGMYSNASALVATWSATAGGEVFSAGNNKYLSNIYPMFAAKYIYKDYQNSVYGSYSAVTVSDSSRYDSIEIDFSDPRLENPALLSDIRNVVLAVSLDGGVTWNQFATLDPWEFAGVGNQKYTYKGTEVLIAIPEAEIILPYHPVPLKSKAQEFADNRIWDGGIVTGYDAVQASLRIDIGYEDMTAGEFYSYSISRPPESVSRWKRGWKGSIGIVYYDDAGRKSPVCVDPVNSDIEIPYYNDLPANGLAPAYLNISVNHTPPDWAVKWQLVRSQDLSQQSFLIWCADDAAFVDDNDNVVIPSLAKYIRINIDNVAYYTDKSNKGAKVNFTYVDGDRIRFIMTAAGVMYSPNDYVIEKVDTTKIYLVYDGSISVADGVMFEIYSPRQEAEKLLYYEFGTCYDIVSSVQNGLLVKSHQGDLQNQTFSPMPMNYPVVASPAVVQPKTGDVWYRPRDLFYNTTGAVANQFRYISDQTPSDYTEIIMSNNGRPNATDLIGRVNDESAFTFSDQYFSGTQVNGLSAIQPANYRKMPTVWGLLSKMQVINNDVLKMVFGNGYQFSVYVNQGVIRQTQGGGNILSSIDDVAANSHIIQRTLGTVNAESVALNDTGDVFGYDETEGVCWLSASNGTVDVSDTGMSITWRNYGLTRMILDREKAQSPAIFDLSHDLYIITLGALAPKPEQLPVAKISLFDVTPDRLLLGGAQVTVGVWPSGTILFNQFTALTSWPAIFQQVTSAWTGSTLLIGNDGTLELTAPNHSFSNQNLVVTVNYGGTGQSVTINFSKGQTASTQPSFPATTLAYKKSGQRRGWPTYFSFTPEMYGRLRNQVLGFKDGRLYKFNASAVYNEFMGVQYDSRLKFVLNKDYPKVKVPLSVWYRGVGNWGVMVTNVPTASYPWGQETEMTPAMFVLEEDGYYSELKKNRLDPRYPTTDQAWVNGEDIRGDAPEIEFYNNQSLPVRLDSTKTLYLYSENS